MILPKLFNHGQLRDIKVDKDKVTFEGTFGKAEFRDTSVNPLPTGGTPGQVLTKYGDDDEDLYWADVNQVPASGSIGGFLSRYGENPKDYAWATAYTVPPAGTAGQVLTKQSSTDGDFEWETPAGGGTSIPEITVTIKFDNLMGMVVDSNNSDASQFDPTYTGDYRISLKFTPNTGVVGKTISDYTLLANYVYYNSQNNEYNIYFPATYIAVGNISVGEPKLMFSRTCIIIGEGPSGWYIQNIINNNVHIVNA